MRLIRAVVRILPQNHDFDVVKLSKAEGVKDIFLWRIDNLACRTFLMDKRQGVNKVRLFFLLGQHIVPGQGSGHGKALCSIG
ncbi:hypothetical protein OS21_02550 [Dickeya oryzae]